MPCDPLLMFERISASLFESPNETLRDLAQALRISEGTIKRTVRSFAGKNFRLFRKEILVRLVVDTPAKQPEIAIKELSFGLGFQSPSSFTRAVRRASGFSPEQLRPCAHKKPALRAPLPSTHFEDSKNAALISEDSISGGREFSRNGTALACSAHRLLLRAQICFF